MSAIEVLPPALAGPYAYANACLRVDEAQSAGTPLDAAVLDAQLARYLEGFPGCDPRAVISMWTHYYFAYLVPPTLASLLIGTIALPIGLGEVGVGFKPDGLPDHFWLRDRGRPAQGDVFARCDALLRGHCLPMVALLSARGVSRRLLWSNVATRIADFADLAEAMGPPYADVARMADLLLTSPHWPDGWQSPLHGGVRSLAGADGRVGRQRRVCCLRYKLPGFADCSTCPLSAGAARH